MFQWRNHMETKRKVISRSRAAVLLICLVCVISGCRGREKLINIDSESIRQTYENNTDFVHSTHTADKDTNSSKTTDTVSTEKTQEIAEDFIEILEDGRAKHIFHLFNDSEQFSVVVPPNWKRGVDGIFSETFVGEYIIKDNKRMEVNKLHETTIEQWKEWHTDDEGPLNGVTAEGCEYIGFCSEPQIEKDVHWKVYYYLIVTETESLYSVSIYYNLDTDSDDFLEKVVIPAVESVIIKKQ